MTLPSLQHRRGLLSLCCLYLSVLMGCVIIPTPEHGLLEGRGKIEATDLAFLEKGKTAREEVLLRFGEPDLILDHGRVLIYHWVVSHGYWFVGGGYSGGGGPIPKNYSLIIEFDEQGLLKDFESTGSIWTSTQSRLDKWTSPEAKKTNREILLVDPTPQARRLSAGAERLCAPIRFKLGEFRVLEGEPSHPCLAGHKIAAFGVIVADVLTHRPLVDTMRNAIGDQLEAAGCRLVVQDPDVILTGDIAEFGVTTSLSLSSWDAIGALDIALTVHSASTLRILLIRRYRSQQASKTFLGTSAQDFEQVMRACLEDVQRQITADAEFAKALGVEIR